MPSKVSSSLSVLGLRAASKKDRIRRDPIKALEAVLRTDNAPKK